jgi:tRNA A-37 threonylcarbamoyl transferase component Bud32
LISLGIPSNNPRVARIWFPRAAIILEEKIYRDIEKALDQTTLLMEEMHSEELVHGDMREDNILLRSEATDNRSSFALIDFDWGGKISEAKFPNRLLNKHIHVSDMKSLLIAKGDDRKTIHRSVFRVKACVEHESIQLRTRRGLFPSTSKIAI